MEVSPSAIPTPKINYYTFFILDYNLRSIKDFIEISLHFNEIPLVVVDAGTKEIKKDYIKYQVASNIGKLVAIQSSRSITLVCKLLGIEHCNVGTLIVWKR